MSTWRSIRGFKGEALKCDSDRLRLSTTLFLQQPTSNGDKVKTVKLPSYLKERLLDGYSSTVVRNLYTDKSLGPQLLADISTWFDCEKDPEIPSRPQECVPSRKYTDAHQEIIGYSREGTESTNKDLTTSEEFKALVTRSDRGSHEVHDLSRQDEEEKTGKSTTWQEGEAQAGGSKTWQDRETRTDSTKTWQDGETRTDSTRSWQDREAQTGSPKTWQKRDTQTGITRSWQDGETRTDGTETWQEGEVQTGKIGPAKRRNFLLQFFKEAMNKYGRKVLYLYVLWQEEERQTDSSDLATRSILLELSDEAMYRSWMEFWCDLSRHVEEALTGNSEIYEEREAQTGSTDSNIKIILLAPSVKDPLALTLLHQEVLNAVTKNALHHQLLVKEINCGTYISAVLDNLNGQLPEGINGGASINAVLDNLNGELPEEAKMKVKLRLREGLRYLGKFFNLMPSSGLLPAEGQNRIVQLYRCQGLLQLAYHIVSKDRDNKDTIDDVLDFVEVQSLVGKSKQLFRKSVDQNTEGLVVDRRYKQAYAAVRESFADIRRNVERWRDRVLHSIVPMFSEGAFNSSVRKMMSRDVARFGKGGNGELVEAFQSGQRLVVKKTLLRESEWSIVTHMDHPNVMPWLALICGDRSDTKPGQVVSYQIMPKMTEDLSASISKMGGSIHHYILQLQEAEEPNSVLSTRADLVRQRGAEILRGALLGLDYMHKQNLVHRDIKASNILLRKPVSCSHDTVHTCTCPGGWEVRVADFDSVIHLNVARERAQRRKQLKVGNTGTSGYRAPEVFFESSTSDINDEEYYSPASDIWSFGGVCLHLAMGFCCPRMQYQVSLITLASHGLVNIPADEVQEKVDKTVGIYHIRQGFTGEKWQDMINFTARPLEVDRCKRPSAKTLLKDSFLMQAHAVQSATDENTKDDR